MKSILKDWNGKFVIDGEVKDNLDDFNPEDGEAFSVRLIPASQDVSQDNDSF